MPRVPHRCHAALRGWVGEHAPTQAFALGQAQVRARKCMKKSSMPTRTRTQKLIEKKGPRLAQVSCSAGPWISPLVGKGAGEAVALSWSRKRSVAIVRACTNVRSMYAASVSSEARADSAHKSSHRP